MDLQGTKSEQENLMLGTTHIAKNVRGISNGLEDLASGPHFVYQHSLLLNYDYLQLQLSRTSCTVACRTLTVCGE